LPPRESRAASLQQCEQQLGLIHMILLGIVVHMLLGRFTTGRWMRLADKVPQHRRLGREFLAWPRQP